MAANKPQDPKEQQLPDLSDPSQRFEKQDVDFVAITRFGIGLVILCICSFLLLTGVFKFFLAEENAAQKPRTATQGALNRVPPEPRLQSTPMKDLATVLAEENAILNSYGWVDKEKGVVRIPVEHAMEILAQRGLPIRQGGAPPASNVTVPAESGLGEIMLPSGGPLAAQLKQVAAGEAKAAPEAKPASEKK